MRVRTARPATTPIMTTNKVFILVVVATVSSHLSCDAIDVTEKLNETVTSPTSTPKLPDMERITAPMFQGGDLQTIGGWMQTVPKQPHVKGGDQDQKQLDKEYLRGREYPAGPVWPEAKSNHYYQEKPVKFEEDFSSTSFANPQPHTPSAVHNSFPYPYQLPQADPVPHRIPAAAFQHGDGHKKQGGRNKVGIAGAGSMAMLKKVLNVLAAFIPLGLFLATIPPTVINVDANSTGTRQRSADGAPPSSGQDEADEALLRVVEELGGLEVALDGGVDCENRLFCEMARLGALPSANIIQRTFWLMANDTPENMADVLGLREILKAVRTGACDLYQCSKPPHPPQDQSQDNQNNTQTTKAGDKA